MAGEDEPELRDLVAQSLEARGVLGKIRAELRANVVLVLEGQERKLGLNSRLKSKKMEKFLDTTEGQIVTGLVRDFLEHFHLDFTCSVFDPESNILQSYPGREKLAIIQGLDAKLDSPLLVQMLNKKAASTNQTSTTSSSTTEHSEIPPVTSLVEERGNLTLNGRSRSVDDGLLRSRGRKDTSTVEQKDETELDRSATEEQASAIATSDGATGSEHASAIGDQPEEQKADDGEKSDEDPVTGSDDSTSDKYEDETNDQALSQLSDTEEFDYSETAQ